MEQIFTVHGEQDIESGYFIGMIPSLPGAHTQAKSMDELSIRLKEVLRVCLQAMPADEVKDIPRFFGTQQIAIAV